MLNEQEKINSNHFGPFKNLADRIGHKYYDFWVSNKILTEAQILRMGDVTLVADLLIAMLEGIKGKKQIKSYYDSYEKEFTYDVEEIAKSFNDTLLLISDIFISSLRTTEFRRIHIFYSLFTSFYHFVKKLPKLDLETQQIEKTDYSRIYASLESIENIFETEDKSQLTKDERQFLEDSRRATTDAKVRTRETEYIIRNILASL